MVDSGGKLFAWYADPEVDPFLRSSAKPFQALPLVMAGGIDHYELTQQELALICASHSGTDQHVDVLSDLHAKLGIEETHLQCGAHAPIHKPTAERLLAQGQSYGPARHNCSGKHSGMLALAKLLNAPLDSYLDLEHPVQQAILKAVAQMASLPSAEIAVGVDGCSATNFALPLHNAAWAYARLMDPADLPAQTGAAVDAVRAAMLAHPDMVGGPGRFDTRVMQVSEGRVLSKGGAEGYQALSIAAGALGPGSPALGVALKIADGDARGWAREAVALEVLRQLGTLSEKQLAELADLGPGRPVKNWRSLEVGAARPIFELQWA